MKIVIKGRKDRLLQQIADELENFDCNDNLSVTITNRRTNEQNRLFHKRLNEICTEIGETSLERLKRDIKLKFGYYDYDSEDSTIKVLQSTSDMSVKSLKDFIEKLEVFMCTELGMVLSSRED